MNVSEIKQYLYMFFYYPFTVFLPSCLLYYSTSEFQQWLFCILWKVSSSSFVSAAFSVPNLKSFVTCPDLIISDNLGVTDLGLALVVADSISDIFMPSSWTIPRPLAILDATSCRAINSLIDHFASCLVLEDSVLLLPQRPPYHL